MKQDLTEKQIERRRIIKGFLLMLLATTISIILTFGTSSVIEHHKKEKAKRDMLLMVLYDFDRTIDQISDADSLLRRASLYQQQVALNPEAFKTQKHILIDVLSLSQMEFIETTEKIFSSNIETFNTLGNVNFIATASYFYLIRQKYKKEVLDPLTVDLMSNATFMNEKALFSVDFPSYAMMSSAFLSELRFIRDKCVDMMGIPQKTIEKFRARLHSPKDSNYNDPSIDLAREMQEAEDIIDKGRARTSQ
ncbi:MAG: hypothetical protein J6Z32_03160 [Bacteroidales bacterium]|nr:hypothetical protein [Bacteroidales bacterium]